MAPKQSEQRTFIPNWAARLKQVGLAVPAIALLELQKPLSFTISQCLLLGQPMLHLFFSAHFTNDMVTLFSDRKKVEQLIQELQQG